MENMDLVFRSGWALPAVLGAAVGALLLCLWWSRPARSALSRALYIALNLLQVVAVLMLVLYLVNPRLRYSRRSNDEGGLAVVVDNSMSMAARDVLDGQSRYSEARRLLLEPRGPLRLALAQKAKLHFFTFSSGLHELPEGQAPTQPDPAGMSTNLAGTFEDLAAQVRSQHLEGVVLTSDGQDTGAGDLQRALRDVRVPVYAIGLGSKSEGRQAWQNAGLTAVDTPTRVALNQEVPVTLRVRQEGFDNSPCQIQLFEGNQLLDTANFAVGGAPVQDVALKYKPVSKGTHTFRAVLTPPAGDSYALDNALEFSVAVNSQTLRILYAEGRLRWVYKFLRRVLESDERFLADCIIRTGPGKLYQQTKSDAGVRDMLPTDVETLAQYDAVILGDFPRSLLSDAQIAALSRYVREKKGGLLVIGGSDLFESGAYAAGPLEALLPVRLLTAAGKSAPPDPQARLQARATVMGRTNPILTGLDTFLSRLTLRHVYDVLSVKQGAETLLEVQVAGQAKPLLISQRVGEGRTLLLTSEDIWSASLQETAGAEQSPTARFWIQTIQWLAQREKESNEDDPLVTVSTDKAFYQPGEKVVVQARLRRPKGEGKWGAVAGSAQIAEAPTASAGPGNAAKPSPAGDAAPLPPPAPLAFPQPDTTGQSEFTWSPPGDGRYEVALQATQEGKTEDVHCRFTVGRPFLELDPRGLNENLLREIARESRGGYFTPLNALDIADALERNPLIRTQIVETDLLDSPWPLLFFCIVVGTQWVLRRRRNLI